MSEREQTTFYDRLFGNRYGFVYPIGKDGKPDYGSVKVGQLEYRIVNIEVIDSGGYLVEQLELDNGQYLPGREIGI